jgi:hypothetical protein
MKNTVSKHRDYPANLHIFMDMILMFKKMMGCYLFFIFFVLYFLFLLTLTGLSTLSGRRFAPMLGAAPR